MQNRNLRQPRNDAVRPVNPIAVIDLPRLKSFKNILNYNIVKQLHLSWQRQGPMRQGSFTISQGQYDSLLNHIRHRWQPFRLILDNLEIETVRYHNETDRVLMQLDTFQARLSRKRPVKYINHHKKEAVLNSPEIEFKFRFRVMTRAN
jgi:hypothetical protein